MSLINLLNRFDVSAKVQENALVFLLNCLMQAFKTKSKRKYRRNLTFFLVTTSIASTLAFTKVKGWGEGWGELNPQRF